MRTNPDLWERLRKLQLDNPGAVFPFSKRLARDNGWSHGFALRAIEEYKRFAYLAIVAGREVTPSDEVDQVWHLHLTYTCHYWGPFEDVLGAPLHHGPTSGGPSEDARYEDNYDATKRLYRAEFGIDPPTDIWPSTAKRFGDAPYFRRLNIKNHWRIPKPAPVILTAAGIVAALTVFATGAIAGKGGHQTSGAEIVAELILLGLAFFVAAYWLHKLGRNGSKGKGGGTGGIVGCGSGGNGDGDGDGGNGGAGCGGGCGGGGCGGGCGGG